MRILNLRLAAICLVAAVVLGTGVHFLHGFQVSRQAHAFLDASKRAEAEKNLTEAIRLMLTYVGLVPGDHNAQLRLGLLYADRLEVRRAFLKLEEVVRMADSSITADDLRKARRKLVDMAIMSERPLDAKVHLAELMKKENADEPDDPELLHLYGQVLIMLNQDEEGCEQLRKAIALAPTQVDTYVRLADVLRSRMERKEEGDAVMYDMIHHKLIDKTTGKPVKDKEGKEIEVNANSPKAFQRYAYYLREREKFDEALAAAKRILELVPEDSVGLWLAGCCYLAKGQYKTAEDYLSRGIKADKSDRAMYLVMADVQIRLGRRDQAIVFLRQGLEATRGTGGYAGILYDLVNACISDSQFADAEKYIKELYEIRLPSDRPFPRELIRFLEAKMSLMKGQWNVAGDILKVGAPKLQDHPGTQKMAYVYLGQCYRQSGEDEHAILAYTEAVKIDPYLASARIGLAEIFQGRGQLADALEQYQMILKGPHPDADAMLSCARILIMMRLREDKEKRDWEMVDKLLDQIQKQNALSPPIAVLKAEVLLAKGHPQDAEDLLAQCAEKFPKSMQVWLALINLAMYQADQTAEAGEQKKKWEQAAQYIERAGQNVGDGPIVREKRASCAIRRKDPRASAVLKELGENTGKMTDLERVHLLASLAALSAQLNDFELGRSFCRRVAEMEPTNVRIRYLYCDLALRAYEKGQTPDLAELDKVLKELQGLGPGGPFWLYGKAVRTFVGAKKTDPRLLLEARGYVQEALDLRKDWSPPAVLAGKICELQEEQDLALDFYSTAIYKMGERDADVISRAVKLLLPRGQIGQAKQLFEYLEKQKSSVLDQMAGDRLQVAVFTDPDIAKVAEDVAKLVPADSKNYQDYLRQAYMYSQLTGRLREKTGKIDQDVLRMAQRAVNAVAKARNLNPQADEVWIALVQLLVSAGQPDKALPEIRKAESVLQGERAAITLGKCYELLQQAEKAQAQYEAAAKASPRNSRIQRQVALFYLKSGKLDRAEPILRQIVSLESPATLTDACWARRGLALILKNRGGFVHLCEGLALVEENLATKAASIDDKRMKAFFLVADPRKEKIVDAIRAAEEVVKGADATGEDYFSLAKLYLKKGQWANYGKAMLGAIGAQAGAVEPRYLIAYIATLLERKEFDEAEKCLLTLEKSAPHLYDTARLKSEYQFLRATQAARQAAQETDARNREKKRKQAEDAYRASFNLAMAFLDDPLAQPQERGQQILGTGQIMERFSDRLRTEGKEKIAAAFAKQADTLFASLRSKRLAEAGDVLYAAYLARQKRCQDCLEVLQECWDKCPAENLGIAATALVRCKAADSAQCSQLERIVVQAANKSDRFVGLLMVLAELHSQQRQYDKAIADYREILAKEPRNYRAMNNLAVCMARCGQDLDQALELVNRTLAVTGPMAEVLDSRAIVYLARQEPEKALADLNAAIQDDGTAEQYLHLAWACLLLERKTEAAAAFEQAKAKGLDPKGLDRREAEIYDRLKDGP